MRSTYFSSTMGSHSPERGVRRISLRPPETTWNPTWRNCSEQTCPSMFELPAQRLASWANKISSKVRSLQLQKNSSRWQRNPKFLISRFFERRLELKEDEFSRMRFVSFTSQTSWIDSYLFAFRNPILAGTEARPLPADGRVRRLYGTSRFD
jgi:hypothetical protein